MFFSTFLALTLTQYFLLMAFCPVLAYFVSKHFKWDFWLTLLLILILGPLPSLLLIIILYVSKMAYDSYNKSKN